MTAPRDGYVAREAGPEWRVLNALWLGRKCRQFGCDRRAVAGLNRGMHTRNGRVDAWWTYCEHHLYGRWIEHGRIWEWVREPAPAGER